MNAASLIRRLGRWLVAAAVFGLVLELSARVDDRVRWNVPLLQANYTHAMLQVSDSLGRRNRPGARFEKWEIDRNGFRGPGAAGGVNDTGQATARQARRRCGTSHARRAAVTRFKALLNEIGEDLARQHLDARIVGELVAGKALEKGIAKVVFDRNG